jgi:hypothetical protein
MGNKRAAGWNYNRLPLPNVCPPLPRTLLPLTPHPFHPAVIFGTSMVTSSSSRVLSSFPLHACCYMCRQRMKQPSLNHKVVFQHPVIFTHDCTLARLCIPHHHNSAASLQLLASSRNKQDSEGVQEKKIKMIMWRPADFTESLFYESRGEVVLVDGHRQNQFTLRLCTTAVSNASLNARADRSWSVNCTIGLLQTILTRRCLSPAAAYRTP